MKKIIRFIKEVWEAYLWSIARREKIPNEWFRLNVLNNKKREEENV